MLAHEESLGRRKGPSSWANEQLGFSGWGEALPGFMARKGGSKQGEQPSPEASKPEAKRGFCEEHAARSPHHLQPIRPTKPGTGS